MATRRWVLAGLAGLSGAAAAACAGSGAPEASGGKTAEPVTVQFGTRGTPDTKPLYEAVADAFAQKQERVRVELWINEPDYYTKLPVAFAGDDAPDVAFTTSRNLLPWHHRGWLLDVTGALARRKVRGSNWFQLAADEWQVGGKRYGVPQGWGTGVMGINKTLFQGTGIALKPEFDATWKHDDFIRLLKQVVRIGGDGNLERWGIDGWQAWSFFWDFGAEFLSKEKTRCTVNTPEGAAGMQWLYDLAWSHRVMPRPKPHDPPVGGANMWQSGNSALTQNGGPHVLPAWPRQLTFGFDIALYPAGPAGKHHRFYSDGYFVWSGSKRQDAAMDFLAYLGTEGQQVLEQHGGRLVPAYRPVAEGIFLKGESPFTKKKWLDALKGAKSQPLVVPFDEMSKIVNTHKNNVLAQKESPREAVAAIEREVNVLLAGYPPPGG
ncbi:MAG: extracellular solute-binding protein [Chloroflexi bacterium]|nr:extracellular solute-binding protein [Chloroflexota bacterium]